MGKILGVISGIALALSILLIVLILYQLIKIILGGSWDIQDITLALLILIITLIFGLAGYIINISSKLANVDKILHGHIQWHKGTEIGKRHN